MIETELAIVGAGPAGLSAAIEAAKIKIDVTVIDENDRPGGQLFKQIHKFFGSKEHYSAKRGFTIGKKLMEDTQRLGVKVLLNTIVWGIFENKVLGIKGQKEEDKLISKKIILATGAQENTLAFPGWTLPGVMGAGAAQTMINIYRVLPGKRVLVVGSGNVGLIVAYQLIQAGAEVLKVLEASDKIGGYAVHASKLVRLGIPVETMTTIKKAEGNGIVESAITVKLDKSGNEIKGTEKKNKVDLICIAVGLNPLSELAWMAGCAFKYYPVLGGHIPVHNDDMETTVKGIYVAGDIAGIEEASIAMEEGRIAAVSIGETLGYISKKEADKRKAEILKRMDELREGPFGSEIKKAKKNLIKVSNGLS